MRVKRIEEIDTGGRLSFAFRAVCERDDGGEVVCGAIDAARSRVKGKVVYRVGRVDVAEPARRQGVGTRLYEAAAKEACSRRGRLASTERLPDARSTDFWEKQVRKGRATAFPIRGADAGRYTRYVLNDCTRLDLSGLGRLTFPQKVSYARRRLVAPDEAIERIRHRHGAAAPSLEELPRHIGAFADFMVESSRKPVTPRQMVKAYVISRSSIQRQARPRAKVCQDFPEYQATRQHAAQRGDDNVRPEDVMAALLRSPDGQTYLDQAERGKFAAGPARRMAKKTACFGFADTLLKDMKVAVRLGKNRELARAVREATPDEWIELVDSPAVPGIGPAKAGFFASLLGRGDTPTFDAREIDLWRRHEGRDPERADVHALRERIAQFPLALPAKYEPHRQHLAHHALWDAYAPRAPSSTTHAEVIDAMRLAGSGLGWIYPLQDCGKPYDKFRAGSTFKDAYDWLAFRKNEQGQSFKPSQKRIVGQLAKMKRSAFEQYEKDCKQQDAGGPAAKTWADCDRVCKVKSQPCGRACISRKRNCRKLPPAARTCSIEDFQQKIPFEQIALDAREAELAAEQAAEDWEEHRRIYGSRRDVEPQFEDVSFDFGMQPIAGWR